MQEEGKQVQLCSRELGMGMHGHMRVEIGSKLCNRARLTHSLLTPGLACVPNHTHYRHAHIGVTLHKMWLP